MMRVRLPRHQIDGNSILRTWLHSYGNASLCKIFPMELQSTNESPQESLRGCHLLHKPHSVLIVLDDFDCNGILASDVFC